MSLISLAPTLRRRELTNVSSRWQELPIGNIQKALYANSLLPPLADKNLMHSRLRHELTLLFPASFELFGIELCELCLEDYELITVKELESELERGYAFSISLSCVYYTSLCDALCLTYRVDIQSSLFNLPKPSDRDTFSVFGLEKVFVSQLARIPSVHVSAKGSAIEISVASSTGHVLNAFANAQVARLSIGLSTEIEYFQGLLNLGIKPKHVLKALFVSAVLARSGLNWKQIVWQDPQCDVNPMEYGARRKLRSTLKFMSARAGGVLIACAVDRRDGVVLNAGSEFDFKCNAIGPVSVVYNCGNVEAFLNNERHVETSWTDSSVLASVDLPAASRTMLNSIMGQQQHQFQLDTLSKRDLIMLWSRLIAGNVHKLAYDANARIVRGCGDVVLDRVLFELKRVLDLDNASIHALDEALLSAFKRIRLAVSNIFVSSELCQYAEQLNSLTELSHRLRLTYMGEGGVTLRTATESLRNVQHWHFGRVCPIESPEGQNIGLVCSYAMFCSVASSGLIQTAFNKVVNGQLSNKFKHLDCFAAKDYTVLMLNKKLASVRSPCCFKGMVLSLPASQIELCYASASQLFSPAVCLIPFLGYNDATRALMAANMQKQALPLIKPMPPLVGTGLEHAVINHTNHNTRCVNNSLIVYCDSYKIIAYEYELSSYRIYNLPLPWRTNQGSCFRVRVTVQPNQLVRSGQHIVECQSSANSEIALGANLLVAFMVWNGLNYEDSVVLSESVVASGVLQSLHIIEHEVKLYKTLLGNETLVDVFNEDCCLTERGAVRIGSSVCDNDVLVGKLTPTLTASGQPDYSDTSYKLPKGTGRATVISVQFNTDNARAHFEDNLSYCAACYNAIRKSYARRVLALAEREKLVRCNGIECELFCYTSDKLSVQRELSELHNSYCEELSALTERCFGKPNAISDSTLRTISSVSDVIEVVKIKLLVRRSIQAGDKISGRHGNKGVISRVVLAADMPYMADGTPIDIVLNPLSVPSRMNLGQVFEAHLGLVSYKWGLEFKRVLDLYNQVDDVSVVVELARAKLSELYPDVDFRHLDAISIMELVKEAREGVRFACHPFIKLDERCISSLLKRVGFGNNTSAQVTLYDGKTGSPFDRKVTVGSMYILKLNHMVDDKLHARSIGPYSIVTQQPLKGKANKGGQRLGEMEVWALQAYGAAFLLREALTVKSDDVEGRDDINKAILANKVVIRTTWNESFLVLIREMCSLCLNVELKARLLK
ncbi:MAG: hypothetical protein AAI978_00625 [Candidatus Hodgkinia cicadicola]